ncbi:hypothetical protein B296_00024133 [Ensete ventricosum]|uniref:Uncharacterized protein n=1 Tax=Ensete ventricosum TaxID=4639 RepID=A0A427AS26_ENSVE|nr:hypothetical protein B296_00024133 [Ensete ventricosum]
MEVALSTLSSQNLLIQRSISYNIPIVMIFCAPETSINTSSEVSSKNQDGDSKENIASRVALKL